jgi:hypothetical protein
MRPGSILTTSAALLWCLGASAIARAQAAPIDYARDVLPILSDTCYHCHGPDEPARKAGLRLDTKDGALRVKDGVAAIVPGDAAASELVKRITSADPDEVMPPPDDIRKLTPGQVETLKRWVEQGAAWGTHWAFVAPKPVEAPKTNRADWARNPVDAFVLARLEQEKLAPAPEADRATLIRRVTLDLTGLPPTPQEVDAFLADAAPDAYERVVDRLLASPRYGERMATDWLDVARYADTHGYQMDRERPTWPYRDWVIKAFNQDLPFDQFVTWQLAGDLLPSATKEQRLATAFNRLHMQNEEGGIVEEEFRVAYVVDRVNTMGTAFLGMTFECSRCHDHKYDPISQRDFYSLFAFFQNIDESGQTSYFTAATPVPTMLLSTDEQDAQLAALDAKVAEKEQQLATVRTSAETAGAFENWLALRGNAPVALPGLAASFSFDEIAPDGKTLNACDPSKPGQSVEGPKLVPGKLGRAADLSGENGFVFPDVGHFSRADAFSLALWVRAPAHAPRATVAHHSMAPIDAGSRGYELLLENGRVAFGLHHMWPGNALKVVARQPVTLDEWTHVTVTYDGSSRAAGVRIYLNGTQVQVEVVRDGLWKDVTYGGSEPNLAIGHRFRDNGFKGGKVDEFQVFTRALTGLEAAHLAGRPDLAQAWGEAPEALGAASAQRGALLDYFLANVHEPARAALAELHAAREAQADAVNRVPEAMVMRETDRPKPAFVLKRGAYDAPGDPVTANTPASLPPFPAGQPRNRLGLARWLVAPENPLTARVTVNRLWQQMFGRGIVETSDNFGSQGGQPTHPELLDWLARTFVDEMRWDVKRLLRTIATSATYRQSSRATPELMQRDPASVLLARGPARRLTAEMLRDHALALSGLLVEKLGGPSVRPYQPDGLWEVAMGNPQYNQGKGEDLYRRSLYTFWKRTVPPPAMVAFDAADRSNCSARRQSTSTPLQALALLNDPQVVEAARFVAQRMLREAGATPETRATWAFKLVTGRSPGARELPVLTALLAEQRELFAGDPAAAAKLLAVGESKTHPSLDPNDIAAGTVLALTLLNHDAAVTRR